MSAERLARAPWCVLGAGRAGVAFATLLSRAGADVAVWTRSERRAERATSAPTSAMVTSLPSTDRGAGCSPRRQRHPSPRRRVPHEVAHPHCAVAAGLRDHCVVGSSRSVPLQSLRGVPRPAALEDILRPSTAGRPRACGRPRRRWRERGRVPRAKAASTAAWSRARRALLHDRAGARLGHRRRR